MNMSKYKRNRIIIKTVFQMKLLVVILTAILLMMLHLYLKLDTSLVIIFGIIVVILMIIISHRIAGPIFRIEKSLENIQSGNLTFRIKFRKGDELSDVAETFNNTLEFLHNKLKQSETQKEEIIKILTEIKETVGSGVLKERLDIIERKLIDINKDFIV